MTIHVAGVPTYNGDESIIDIDDAWLAAQEALSPPPAAGWTFAVGQRVRHANGSALGAVVARSSTTKMDGAFSREMAWVEVGPGAGRGNLRLMLTEILIAA